MIFALLNGVLEEKQEHIDLYLPKVVEDIIQTKWKLEKGLSRFVQVLSDVVADAPHAPHWFFNLVLKAMLTAGRVDLKRFEWLQPEEDIFAVGGHIQLLAMLIKFKTDANKGDVSKALEALKGELGTTMKTLIEKMEENGEDKEELRAQVTELTNFSSKDG